MNKSYKTVWNETTGTYVAASEVAKSRGKKSRNQKALVAAMLAAGVGFGTAVKSEAAATPSSFAVGVLGTDATNSGCISSADGAVVTTGTNCASPSGAQAAGMVSYDTDGKASAYVTVTDPKTVHIGAGGNDQLKITDGGLFVLTGLDMGGTKITNVAAGTASTDAVNFGQLTGSAKSLADALGGGAVVKANGTISGPSYVLGGSTYSSVGSALTGLQNSVTSIKTGGINYFHAIAAIGGADSSVANVGDIAIGGHAKAASNGSGAAMAVGSDSQALANSTVAIGPAAKASFTGDAAFGMNAQASGNLKAAVALGQNSNAQKESSVALGANATASATNSVALGASSSASRDNTVSVGSSSATRQVVNVGAGTSSTDAVNYGQLQAAGLKVDTSGSATNSFVAYDDTTKGTVTLGGDTKGTKLANVAAGDVSASSTDAVNGAQLYKSAASMAAALGGGSSVSADGTVSAPAYSVGGSTVNSVGAAITNLDGRMAANATSIGSLQTTVSGITSGSTAVNSAYMKAIGRNDGTDGAVASNFGSIAIGPNAAVADAVGGVAQIAIGYKASAGNSGFSGAIAVGASANAT